ncbi:MAG: hypothetical protein HOW73_46650 [Polyangiaceae bacterium]|nr:hypothetical protein [Polyangiaceae bacterium]
MAHRKLVSLIVACFIVLFAATASAEDKAGPLEVGGKLGFGVSFGDLAGVSFVFSPEIGYALDGENAYLIFDPEIQAPAGDGAFFTIPATFQYDIELPVDGLYIYPRGSLGVSVFSGGGNPFFTVTPACGIKYQVLKQLHVGGEPIRFPIHVTDGAVFAQYEFLVSVGADLDP